MGHSWFDFVNNDGMKNKRVGRENMSIVVARTVWLVFEKVILLLPRVKIVVPICPC